MTNPKLALIPSGYKNSKVYSILPNDGSGDFTFARNSGGTRVNKQGLIEQMQTYGSQLLNNSDFTSTSDWTVSNTGSAASVIENGYLHINTSGDYSVATQALGLTAGDIYRVDYEILENTAGTISIIGNGGASTIIPSTVGKHTIEYDAQSTFAVKRTTGSTNIKIAYIKLYKVQYNTPRLDWSDSNCPSLLLEPQSTNLVIDSEDLSALNQTNINPVISPDISPSGKLNSWRATRTGSNNRIGSSFSAVSGLTYTTSIYAKKVSGSGIINITDYQGNPNAYNLTEKWQRYTLTASATSTTGRAYVTLQNIGDVVDLYGLQSEQQSFATSYIPTFSGQYTRLADTCTGSTDATIFNDSEGVLYAEIAALADDGTFRLISLDGGDNTNVVKFGYRTTSNAIYYEVRSGNVSQAFQIYTTTDVKQFHKVAVLYQQNNFKLFINGVNVLSDTSGITPVGLNNISFNVNYAAPFYGNCKELRYYDTALTDAELTELTT
jgi:hypothetical protein